MPISFVLVDAKTGNAAKVNPDGELIVGSQEHSTPFNAQRSTAGVTNIVLLETNKRFILTYLVVSSDKTNLETQVYIYETKTIDGNNTTAEKMILAGGLSKNDRVVLGGLDLETLPSRFVNLETDTAATIDVTLMGYYETVNI